MLDEMNPITKDLAGHAKWKMNEEMKRLESILKANENFLAKQMQDPKNEWEKQIEIRVEQRRIDQQLFF